MVEQYVGIYELAPTVTITITLDEGNLGAQLSGLASGRSQHQGCAPLIDLAFGPRAGARVRRWGRTGGN